MPTYKLSKKHRSQSKELNLKHTEDEMAYDTGSMEGSFGVRKGSWTEEEDKLLRQCIEAHGEGKWHQVPTKAGLNRCRKSCRLRWLNYLKPNIKRGKFEVDEVDLMIRLHKLLGNRWSLIAGRLPGRTANDVKNYWNTHLKKKVNSFKKSETQQITKTKVIKPRPRSLSKTLFWSSTGQPQTPSNVQVGHQNHHHHHHRNSSSALQADDNNNNNKNEQSMWWEELLKDPEIDDQANNSTICETVVNGEEATFVGTYGESFSRDKEVDEGTLSLGAESESFWGDFFLDGDLWNFPDL